MEKSADVERKIQHPRLEIPKRDLLRLLVIPLPQDIQFARRAEEITQRHVDNAGEIPPAISTRRRDVSKHSIERICISLFHGKKQSARLISKKYLRLFHGRKDIHTI